MDMDWRQRRTIAALSTILTVLFILVLVVGGIRYHQHRSAQGAIRSRIPPPAAPRIPIPPFHTATEPPGCPFPWTQKKTSGSGPTTRTFP